MKFAAKLREMFPSDPNAEQARVLLEEPSYLAKWAFARLLLDEPPDNASAWLDQLTGVISGSTYDLPLSPLMHWTSLAATAELLGQPALGGKAARTALEHLGAAERETDWDQGITQLHSHGLALSAYLADDDGAARWRGKLQATPLFSFDSVIGYALLYLSGNESLADDLDRLSLEVARVYYDAVRGLLQHVGPLFLTFAARARRNDAYPLETLRGAIHRLDEAVRPARGKEPLSFGSASFERSKRDGRAALQVAVRVEGSGRLRIGPCQVTGLTSEFAKGLYDHATEGGSKKAASAFKRGRLDVVEASLAFDPAEVEVTATERDALRRRFDVAFEQAKAWLPGLSCAAELHFSPQE